MTRKDELLEKDINVLTKDEIKELIDLLNEDRIALVSISMKQAKVINKAIEYIKEVKVAGYIKFIDSDVLIDILRGEDNE